MVKSISEYLAAQFRKPSGYFGKIVMTRLLNFSNSEMNQSTLGLLDIKNDDEILEIGFGGGALLSLIASHNPKAQLYGVDYSKDMVSFGEQKLDHFIQKKQLQLMHASAENLPYLADSFTKICCVNVVYFWESCSDVFEELKRVLREKGLLIVSFGDVSSLKQQRITQHGFNLYSLSEIQQQIESAGFTICAVREMEDRQGKFNTIVAKSI